MLRQQLPVHSPLSPGALVGGAFDALTRPAHPARELTSRLRAQLQAPAILLTDSGTSALTLALRGALRATAGAPVALPAYTCYDVATAALGSGARAILYDIDPETLHPNERSLKRALQLGAKAIVCAPLYGLVPPLQPLRELARRSGALLILDAAQAWGSRERGSPFVAGGTLGVLSFGRGKGFTGGAGGALLGFGTQGVRILDSLRWSPPPRRGWAELTRASAQWALARPGLYAIPASLPFLRLGETVFHRPAAPRAMSSAAAAVLCRCWRLADEELGVRQRNAERLLSRLLDHPVLRTPAAAGVEPVPPLLRLPVLAEGVGGAMAASAHARALGIMRSFPRALCDLDGFSERVENRDHDFNGARHLAAQLYTLPTHGRLRPPDLTRLERWIEAVARAAAGRGEGARSGAEEKLEAEVGG